MYRPGLASTVEMLRQATAQLHQSLHEHPLMVQLLTAPTWECYRAVLKGFYAFYVDLEPTLIVESQCLGVGYLYPTASRTQRLAADLRALGGHSEVLLTGQKPVRVGSVAELLGCLYVIKGSSLGSQVILRRLSRRLMIQECCRYLRGDAEDTNRQWRAFLSFLNDACRDDADQHAATVTACQTFQAIGNCLWLCASSRREIRASCASEP